MKKGRMLRVLLGLFGMALIIMPMVWAGTHPGFGFWLAVGVCWAVVVGAFLLILAIQLEATV